MKYSEIRRVVCHYTRKGHLFKVECFNEKWEEIHVIWDTVDMFGNPRFLSLNDFMQSHQGGWALSRPDNLTKIFTANTLQS